MTHTQVHLSQVIYNAATQSFEALATVKTKTDSKTFPCSIEAPITMSFERAASGLKTQALRANASGTGMYSQMRHHMATVRAGRPRFDPRTWLAQLGFGSLDKAA
ncbi:orotidine 5-phosphate decarboxylase [uncultured Sulfitobacter sp.]|uniref:orotidine 5-phosphate decarboxylase n=1 Tax=uncultured Sulfitobacter sp. TaxID=191468 RepID=UPI002627C851|nr:orotidine 5-phosphate decarboxylase [uncultured Sulfitobacter sp.]